MKVRELFNKGHICIYVAGGRRHRRIDGLFPHRGLLFVTEHSCSAEYTSGVLTSACASKPKCRAAHKLFATPQKEAFVKRTTPIRVISFFLLACCAASCQELASSEWKSLPNAPLSIQPPRQVERFHTFFIGEGLQRGAGQGQSAPGPQPSFTILHQVAFVPRKISVYAPSTSASLMGRVSYAASSLLIARDGSGKGKLNTTYFIEVLTSVAAHAAYRSPKERSTSTTFNNLGSTIGSDAGINVYHEFGPGIRQIVKKLTPRFGPRTEELTTHEHTSHAVAPALAKLQ